jgi:hypothetical protein
VSIELIVALVILVVAVAAVAWWFGQRRRTERLRETFGSEYDRTVETADNRGRAEAELEARKERVDALDIRPLAPGDSARFADRWRIVQALFVDDPARAVDQADTLIAEVMRARGYPVGDFEQRAADISVGHPEVVDHYRLAHRIASRRDRDADTEALRQAFVHYRALFAELLDSGEAPAGQQADDEQPELDERVRSEPTATLRSQREMTETTEPVESADTVEPARRP